MSTFDSILLFGPPGVGKGTQGKVLGTVPGFFHHSSGDVFRSLDKQSELGQTFLSYSTKGELVPDDLTIDIWRSDLDRRVSEGTVSATGDIVVLDGIPRNANQAELMKAHVRVLGVIHLVASDENELIERLRKRAEKEDRPDDADVNVIKRRLEIYTESTRPMLDLYDKSLIHDIDALGTPAEVLRRVLDAVIPLQ
ncbi:MAG: nucleoside monophosphate kinase [Planctomycetota bacterium]